MAKASTEKREELTKILERVLEESASLSSLPQEIVDKLAHGHNIRPTKKEALIRKIVDHAVDPNDKNQWAVDLVMSYMVGKPKQVEKEEKTGRDIEERLDDISRANLNILAGASGGIGTGGGQADQPAEDADGYANPLLDLPSNRSGSAEDLGGEL